MKSRQTVQTVKVIAVILILAGFTVPIAFHWYAKRDAERRLVAFVKENGGEWPKGWVSESVNSIGPRIMFLVQGDVAHNNLKFFDPLGRQFTSSFLNRLGDGSICEVAIDGRAKVLSGSLFYSIKRQPLLPLLSVASVLGGLALLTAIRKKP
jgi:hypothetical protein